MYKKEKRVPTVIALVILFLGIGGAVYLDKTLHIFTSSAKEEILPQEVRFANINDNSFTVSWLTSSPATSAIAVSSGPQSITFLDDFDNDNIPRPRYTHYVTVKNLKEDTNYTVKIYNTDLKCRNALSCPSYNQKTGLKLTKIISLPPAHGTIISKTGNEATGALVYLTVGKSALLASRSDSSGLWAIPLTNLRSENLSKRPEIADNDIAQITVFSAPSKSASAVIDIRSIRQNLSVPAIQIGNTYNFISTSGKKELAQTPKQQVLGSQAQFTASNKIYDILFPFQDGDYTPDPQPEIRGIGISGSRILITVNSTPQTASVTVDQNGTWRWRPPLPLEPGTHNLSIQGYDQSGNLITVTRQFIVLKSGEQVLGEATASATLTPTLTPLPTPTLLPTITYTPTLTSVPPTSTPQATPPASGSTQSTIILIGGALFLILSGIKFLTSI